MAIKKVIDGKLVTIADKSITDHSELTGTQAYGCHPISAIRKLPERLHALKEADEKLAEDLDTKIASAERLANIVLEKTETLDEVLEAANNTVNQIQTDINKINLKVDGTTVSFTNVAGETQSFRVGADVDNDTISINSKEQLTLKKVYINEELLGNGTAESPLMLKNKVDNKSIIINDNKYEVKAIKGTTDDEIITYQTITNKNIENENKFTAIQKQFEKAAEDTQKEIDRVENRLDERIELQDAVDNARRKQIDDLYTRTQGMGGYLNAYDFGKNPTQDDLTNYALQEILVLSKEEIFNGTRVKNLYDNHIWILTNTQDSDPVVFSWEDHGEDATISDANNDGIHGLVTGSYEDLEGFIDTLGHITINGLKEELEKLTNNDSDLEDKINTDYAQLDNKIESSYGTLLDKITEENERAVSAETTLQEALDAEIQSRTDADADIKSKLNDFATKDNLKDAFYSKATNVITSPTDDTVNNWCALGGGIYWFAQNNALIGQPSTYGFVLNIPLNSGNGDVTQLFFSQRDGQVYHRGGNGAGWGNNGQWRMLIESANNNFHTIPHDLIINGTLYLN